MLIEVSEPKSKDVATESGHVKVMCDLTRAVSMSVGVQNKIRSEALASVDKFLETVITKETGMAQVLERGHGPTILGLFCFHTMI